VQGLFVDDLFERVQEASTALTARYPQARHGLGTAGRRQLAWRPPADPASTTVEPNGLPKEALEPIARVRKAVEKRQLTPEEGQSIITAIVLEYE
jgi:hypothetical protein